MTRRLTPTEAAWVAGLLEGEGCFTLYWSERKDKSLYPRFGAQCNMTDKDVIEHLHELCGGTVQGPKIKYTQHGVRGKDQWLWTLGRRAGLSDFLPQILPYMASRRSAKIALMLTTMSEYPPRDGRAWEHGVSGYKYHGCKCAVCTKAHTDHYRTYRQANRDRINKRNREHMRLKRQQQQEASK